MFHTLYYDKNNSTYWNVNKTSALHCRIALDAGSPGRWLMNRRAYYGPRASTMLGTCSRGFHQTASHKALHLPVHNKKIKIYIYEINRKTYTHLDTIDPA